MKASKQFVQTLSNILGDGFDPGEPEDEPRGFLLMDGSASMSADGKLDAAKEGAKKFLSTAFEDGYAVGVIRFALSATVVTPITYDHAQVLEGLRGLRSGGGTDIAAAITCATEQLGHDGLRVIVLVTDGQSNPHSAFKAAEQAKAAGITIVCVGTDDADFALLRRLASQEGFARHVDRKQLADAIADAARLLPAASTDDDDDSN